MTDVPIKEYLDTRIAYLERCIHELDGGSKFVTREELSAKLAIIEADVRVLREFKAVTDSKASQTSVNIALVLSVIGIIISVIKLIINI